MVSERDRQAERINPIAMVIQTPGRTDLLVGQDARQRVPKVGTARCAVRAASSGATSVVEHRTANIPPALRAVTAQRAAPTIRQYVAFFTSIRIPWLRYRSGREQIY
jgi:hypothetical protein